MNASVILVLRKPFGSTVRSPVARETASTIAP
jgi:hypothetical protein